MAISHSVMQVAGKKQRDTAAADAEIKAKKAARAAEEKGDTSGPGDLLATEEDNDVIF